MNLDISMAGERHQAPMAEYTTWHCGGEADTFYTPDSLEDLSTYLGHLDEGIPITYIGRGSNVLVRDGGMRGVVIQLCEALSSITVEASGVRAQGGVSCARLATTTAGVGLCGMEFLAGIPGTVGGALVMNAGAAGSEIWDYVDHIETVDRHGERHRFDSNDIRVGYRFAQIPVDHGVVLGVFHLQRDEDVAAPRRRIEELMAHRRATQPVSRSSGGSVFRNPPGKYAAQLIEEAGLKGYRIGGAEVSETHANFITNDGAASAADIERLIEYVRHEVEVSSGIRMELEVKILGDAA